MSHSQREFWFTSSGARLFAVEQGCGTPIVLLHGGLADHRASLARVGALASQYRIVTPDLRGSGRSVHAGELSFDLLADDLCALLDQLAIERAAIGGTSAGSAVALRFALRYPERTRGLIVMSPVYAGEDRGLNEAQRAAFRAMDELGRSALTHGVDVLRVLYGRLPQPVRERALEMMRGFDAASVAATTRFLASGAQPFASLQQLAAITAPVLLVPGTDPEHPAELAALYAQHLRTHVIVPSSADLSEPIDRFCRSLA